MMIANIHLNYLHLLFHSAADHINEKIDKGLQISSPSPRDKLITFKNTPLKTSKSNELGTEALTFFHIFFLVIYL
jgi:hypothetical protein